MHENPTYQRFSENSEVSKPPAEDKTAGGFDSFGLGYSGVREKPLIRPVFVHMA